MARPRKHPGRCGCESSWTFPDAQENPSCCEHAQTAPCWYAMSFECGGYSVTYEDVNGVGSQGFLREALLGSPVLRDISSFDGTKMYGGCHFLKKECVTGCAWGDRWYNPEGYYNDHLSNPLYEQPFITLTNCPTSVVCDDVTDPPDVLDLTAIKSFLDSLHPSRDVSCSPCGFAPDDSNCVECSWAESCAGGNFTAAGIQECRYGVNGESFLLRKKWEMLMLSATEATLVCTSNMGWTAQYYCGDFDPMNKSTFVRNEATVHEKLIGLPVKICVIPISKPVANPCTTVAAKCACMDPGFCGTTIWVNVAGCKGFSGGQTINLTRMYSVGSGLSGVSMPSSAPCGFFWGTIGPNSIVCSSVYKNQLGIQIWCDGVTYLIAVYCLKIDGTWEFVPGAAITSIIPTCFGPELFFRLPETLPCCCAEDGPPIETNCCPDNPIPRTLTAEAEITLCTECTGTGTASATYVEGETYPTWDVDVTVCSRTYTIRLVCQPSDGGGVAWTATMTDTDPDCGLGLPYGGSLVSSDCDPLEIVFIWSVSGCCGDILEAPLLTITWTE